MHWKKSEEEEQRTNGTFLVKKKRKQEDWRRGRKKRGRAHNVHTHYCLFCGRLTMPDDAGDTVSLKCCASIRRNSALLGPASSTSSHHQRMFSTILHMTAEGSSDSRVHPNSHLQAYFDVTVTACTYILPNNLLDTTLGMSFHIADSVRHTVHPH
ncbi:hypothetical protein BLNAU_20927 [Blattamonas nauphoetae]|uniref:Uncharacterized protein n=1 Tax=Blattamonas nauphoetae TaxID=2049346 RepID=A0ABQ9WZI7_9EUKA|nr:hypothetical protein BLNAU_20927 [Blattamonas nauphoetae]